MKRVIVAVVLLLLVAVGCIVAIVLQHDILEEFLADTVEMEQLFLEDDLPAATNAAATFAEQYTKKTKYFSLFLPQSLLTETQKSVVSLTPILQHGEHKDFVAEVHRCRLLLQKLHDMEVPTWQNVF